ncbi:MAG: hypothetical protein L0322_07480, partial [Chloroflexi bacterium]|nr:hypothetical protein [Chloroflexota bacterium]
MTTLLGKDSELTPGRPGPPSPVLNFLVRLAVVVVIDIFAVWFVMNLVSNAAIVLAVAIGLLALLANVVLLRNRTYPVRWMLPGLIMMALFSIYPIIYTVYVAFTNYGDEHLLTKERTIAQIQREKFLPEGGRSFTWSGFRAPDGQFALWLQSEAGQSFLALPGQPIIEGVPGQSGVGELDEDGIPVSIEGYERLPRNQLIRYINDLGQISFGVDDFAVQVRSLDDAAELEPLYEYDAARDVLVNQQTGVVYTPIDGTFTSPGGEALRPGFRATVGLENFQRFFTSPALRGPLLQIVLWNFAFAFLSVFMTFALGLAIAAMYNDSEMVGRKLIRTLLLIPYTIPSLITILIWRGMLNPELGVINRILESLIGSSPPW